MTKLYQILVLTLLMILSLGPSTLTPGTAQAIQDPAPIVSAKQLMDSIAANKGRVLVVNFWATWCGPCQREFPELDRLRRTIPDDKLGMLSVSLDFDRDSLLEFLKRNPLPYPVVMADSNLMDELKISIIPKTWFFSPNGEIFERRDGPVSFEALKATVHSAAQQTAVPKEKK